MGFIVTALKAVAGFIGGSTVAKLGVGILLSNAIRRKRKKRLGKSKPSGIKGTIETGANIPLSFHFGKTATAGKLEFHNTWGKAGDTPNAYYTQIISLCDIPIQSVTRIWVDAAEITFSGSLSTGKGRPIPEYRKNGADHLWIRIHLGDQVAIDPLRTSISTTERPWDAKAIGDGIPYAVVTSLYNRELFTKWPVLLFEVTGMKLEDISKARTGGDGDHNPVVQIYNVFKGIKYNGELFYGGGLPAAKLPSANWIDAINACRKQVTTNAGGKEASFRSGLEVSIDTPPADVIDILVDTCGAKIFEVGGQIKIQVGEPPVASLSITDDNILYSDDENYSPGDDLADTVNAIDTTYPNPDQMWKMDSMPTLLNADYEKEDGGHRYSESLELVASPYYEQNLRLRKSALAEYRREFRHTIPLPPEFWILDPCDSIEWTSKRWGYTNKLFRVDIMTDSADLDVTLDITEVNSSDHAFDASVDYKAPLPTPTMAIVPIPVQAVQTADFSVAAINISSGSNALIPGLRVSWTQTATQTDISMVAIQAITTGSTTLIANAAIEFGAGEYLIYGMLLPLTSYDVRIKYMPFSGRETSWSAWKSATTGDARARFDQIAGDVVESQLATALSTLINSKLSSPVIEGQLSSAVRKKLNATIDISGVNTDIASIKAELFGDAMYQAKALRFDNLDTIETTFADGHYALYADYAPDPGDSTADSAKSTGLDTAAEFAAAQSVILSDAERTGTDVSSYLDSRGVGDLVRFFITQSHWYDYKIRRVNTITTGNSYDLDFLGKDQSGAVLPYIHTKSDLSVLFVFTPSSVPTELASWLENEEQLKTLTTYATELTTLAKEEQDLTAMATKRSDILTVANLEAALSALAKVQTELVSIASVQGAIEALSQKSKDLLAIAASITAIQDLIASKASIDILTGIVNALSALAGNEPNLNKIAADAAKLLLLAKSEADILSIVSDKKSIDALVGQVTDILAVAGELASITSILTKKTQLLEIAGIEPSLKAISTYTKVLTALAQVGDPDDTMISWELAQLLANTQYNVQIRARNSDGGGAVSSVSLTTFGIPAIPAMILSIGDAKIRVSWALVVANPSAYYRINYKVGSAHGHGLAGTATLSNDFHD